jgi:hypothetical protein
MWFLFPFFVIAQAWAAFSLSLPLPLSPQMFPSRSGEPYTFHVDAVQATLLHVFKQGQQVGSWPAGLFTSVFRAGLY